MLPRKALIEVKCRICSGRKELIDTWKWKDKYSHLHGKLQVVTGSETKYNKWLRFICASCKQKLEDLSIFKIRCMKAYREFLDSVEEQRRMQTATLRTESVQRKDKKSVGHTEKIFVAPVAPVVKKLKSSTVKTTDEKISEIKLIAEETSSKENSFKWSLSEIENVPQVETENKATPKEEMQVPKTISSSKKQPDVKIDRKEFRTKRPNNESFTCGICGKIFYNKNSITIHINDVHLKIHQCMCRFCGKLFTGHSGLKRHENAHMNPKIPCDLCDKKVICHMRLKQHKHEVHFDAMRQDEKPFICIYCNEDLKEHNLYHEHLQQIHSELRLIKCRYCPKKISQLQLSVHERQHTEERPHKCEICSRTFKNRKTLVKHKAVHGDRTMYPCELCNKSFTTASNRKYHMRIHTGETPFACSTCPEKFYDKKMCQKHSQKCKGPQ